MGSPDGPARRRLGHPLAPSHGYSGAGAACELGSRTPASPKKRSPRPWNTWKKTGTKTTKKKVGKKKASRKKTARKKTTRKKAASRKTTRKKTARRKTARR